MPQKTIYVKEEDLPVFEEAMALGEESLSGIIVESLREYLDKKKKFEREKKEWILEVGEKKVSFIAQLIFSTIVPKYRKIKEIEKESVFMGMAKVEVEKEKTIPKYDKYEIYLSEKGSYLIWWNVDGEKDYCIVEQIDEETTSLVGKMSREKICFESIGNQFLAQYFHKNRVSNRNVEKLVF